MALQFPNEWSGNRKDEIKEGNYFIIDWVVNNPMKPEVGIPKVIVANATEEDLEKISKGIIKIPHPTVGASLRILAKVEKINKI